MIRTLYFRLVKYNIAVLSNKAFTIYFIFIYQEIMDRIRVGIYKSYSIKERNNLIEDFMSLIRGMYLKLSEVIYWVL